MSIVVRFHPTNAHEGEVRREHAAHGSGRDLAESRPDLKST